MDEDKQFTRAKDYAYKLLSYRQRSRKEVEGRLRKKGFPAQIIQRAIAYLSELDYLNDEKFAQFWVRSKMERAALGWPLLCYQLRQKGICEEILNRVKASIFSQYNEIEAAQKLAVSRYNRYKNLQPDKRQRRLYAYLKRRGFSQEAILQAIKENR